MPVVYPTIARKPVTSHLVRTIYRRTLDPHFKLPPSSIVTSMIYSRLVSDRLLEHEGGKYFLTPEGQLAVWKRAGSPKGWEDMPDKEKMVWRKRIIQFGIELARRKSVRIPTHATARDYNQVVRRALFTKLNGLTREVDALDQRWRFSKDQSARMRYAQEYSQLYSLYLIFYAVATELKLGDINAPSFW